uniref:Uncharacterized protein n=1 Tax=Anopheles atroparvus TaxID=41427 RepID=A0AAG5CNZ1_ANOAO
MNNGHRKLPASNLPSLVFWWVCAVSPGRRTVLVSYFRVPNFRAPAGEISLVARKFYPPSVIACHSRPTVAAATTEALEKRPRTPEERIMQNARTMCMAVLLLIVGFVGAENLLFSDRKFPS